MKIRITLKLAGLLLSMIFQGCRLSASWLDQHRPVALLSGAVLLAVFDFQLIFWTYDSFWDCKDVWVPCCRTLFTAMFIIGTALLPPLALRRFQFFA